MSTKEIIPIKENPLRRFGYKLDSERLEKAEGAARWATMHSESAFKNLEEVEEWLKEHKSINNTMLHTARIDLKGALDKLEDLETIYRENAKDVKSTEVEM